MSGFRAGLPHLRLVEKERNLRAVPKEGESLNNFICRQEKTLQVVTGWFEEVSQLSAAKRTLKKHINRANECGATERAAYLETALDSLEEGMRTRS